LEIIWKLELASWKLSLNILLFFIIKYFKQGSKHKLFLFFNLKRPPLAAGAGPKFEPIAKKGPYKDNL